ncbi:hypothetical protein [Streptomyces sp. NPDC045470]|uniref:hypothetical protein n=1 Tax=Streptomyces sp. NPDC045470 TaxID=3155469 RepID=UPI0033EB3B5A
MSSSFITISFNCQENGFGSRERRLKVLRRLRSFNPALVLRQEMPGAADHARAVMYKAEDPEVGLGMRGWLGEGSATAVFADTAVLRPVAEYPSPAKVMERPPTAVGFQLAAAGPESTPVIGVAGHNPYPVPVQREIETGWLTTFNDKVIRMADGSRRKAYIILGIDAAQATPGEVPLPQVRDIGDEPHRAHRTRRGPDGTYVMD